MNRFTLLLALAMCLMASQSFAHWHHAWHGAYVGPRVWGGPAIVAAPLIPAPVVVAPPVLRPYGVPVVPAYPWHHHHHHVYGW